MLGQRASPRPSAHTSRFLDCRESQVKSVIMARPTRIAVIGHGEAGSLIAGGLFAAGANVVSFDPARPENPTTPLVASLAEAITSVDLVLSINSSTVAYQVAESVAKLMNEGIADPDAVFADMNTGTPAMKHSLADMFASGAFADIAIMRPVPGLAEKVPLAVSGSGAKRCIELLEPFGLNLEFVSDVAGHAAARKLLRSILAKGIAGVVIDFLWAAESMGLEEWAHREILDEFDTMNATTAQRYIDGTSLHFKRRQIELADVLEMLTEAGYESTMVAPIQFNYGRIMHGKKIPFARKKKR